MVESVATQALKSSVILTGLYNQQRAVIQELKALKDELKSKVADGDDNTILRSIDDENNSDQTSSMINQNYYI